jgi:enoyl-CoA hydratase/carnithine racemase
MSDTAPTLEDVSYEVTGDVAVIEIDRPAVMNSIRHQTVTELEQAYERAREGDVEGIVLESAGDTIFCAGADLEEIESYMDDVALLEEFLGDLQRVVLQFSQGPLPVIGCVDGAALAGGLEIVLGCDVVVATPEATFGDQHANFDLVAGGGGTQLLPRIVGPSRAKYLILSGDRIDAETAREWGLISEVTEDAGERAQAVADQITDAHPDVTRRAKELVETGLECSIQAGLTLEREVASKHLASDVARAGIERFKRS